ncbi:GLPGLI family protein [Chryseobacterium herbae]|uniref:GLPGLI family protein n=1 Tax=Chryseobacterium herbae TaxID=2976476 RepID=A0ABT2IYL9_9FLAO|nr:GLPGLI family protein [Chryseobacterium sp. pc1-10]MCT2563917.1 GLPGLI family protein [Chryseobacterium sp. pc1-10]
MRLLFTFWAVLQMNFICCQNMTFLYEVSYKSSPNESISKTENYYLDLFGSESVFRSENDRQTDSIVYNNGRAFANYIDFNQLYCRKNINTKKVYKTVTTPLYNDVFDILAEDINWKVLPETMMIADMNCQKAVLEYGGRNWEAWFTVRIPIQEGPYVFYGLPGLIVKISDEKKNYSFSLVESHKSEQSNLFRIRKGKLIDWAMFEKIQRNFYSEPFAELKARNTKMIVTDDKGNKLDRNYDDMSEKMRITLRARNNPVELNHKIDYK